MSIRSFVPEVWSKKLLTSIKKKHVYVSLCNRDYEGEINEAGDTVRINSVSRPTIGTYTAGSTSIVPEQLTTAQRSLTVDQAKYFAFEVDDVDKRQALGGVMEEAMVEAAYGLAEVSDAYVEALMRAGAGTSLGTIALVAATPTDVYDDLLVPLAVAMDNASLPTEGRFIVVPPWVHGRLLLDSRFIKANESGTEEGLRNGRVGRAAGLDILTSVNALLVTGDDYSVIGGLQGATSYAEQINKTEAYRPQDSFSDAVKGLHLYGAKVVRPNMLFTALASQT